MAKASLQSISAALRYIECLRFDTFSEIAGKDLHRVHTSPLSRDSGNLIILSDEALTLTLRGADADETDFGDADTDALDNFSFEGIGIRWRRSAEYLEDGTDVPTETLAQIVAKATRLLESIRSTAASFPPFRDQIRAAADGGLWKVWVNAETREVLPAPQF